MLFVALYSTKPTFSVTEAVKRRMEWKPPEGTKRVAEYWLQSNSPSVIVIFEADDIAPIMANNAQWMDLYDFAIVPATTAEEGLKIASQMMPKT